MWSFVALKNYFSSFEILKHCFTQFVGMPFYPNFIICIGALFVFCYFSSSYNGFDVLLGNCFVLLIFKGNDIFCTLRSLNGPALYCSSFLLVLLSWNNKKCSFYFAIHASLTSFPLYHFFPLPLLPHLANLNSILSSFSSREGFFLATTFCLVFMSLQGLCWPYPPRLHRSFFVLTHELASAEPLSSFSCCS